MNEKTQLELDIRKIRRQLKQDKNDEEWRKRAVYALDKKQKQLEELQQKQRRRAHNIKPSELVLLMFKELSGESETREIARIFLEEKCGYEVK